MAYIGVLPDAELGTLRAVKYPAGVQFLRTELRVGFTSVKIAQAATDEAKRNRNRKNAQDAYEAVLRFSSQADAHLKGGR